MVELAGGQRGEAVARRRSGSAGPAVQGVVQVALVHQDAEMAAQVFGPGRLLPSDQVLVGLFAVASADHLQVEPGAEDLAEGPGQGADGAGGRLLHEDVPGLGVRIGVEHQVYGIGQAHHEPGHLRVCHRQRAPRLDLLDEERDHRTARGHDVAVARGREHRLVASRGAGLGDGDLLAQRLGQPHGVDRIDRLVRGEHGHPPHLGRRRRVQHVLGAEDVGARRLERVELARGHLLQRRGMEHQVDVGHGPNQALVVPDVADDEAHARVAQGVAQVVLLLLVAAEDADFAGLVGQRAAHHRLPEGAGAAGDQKRLA